MAHHRLRPLPSALVAAAHEEERSGWLGGLDARVADAADRWGLEVGAPYEPGGRTAWVAPATGPQGERWVLKVAWPHDDGAHEAPGLRAWAGAGAVLLHDAVELDGASVLLLERCQPGAPLSAVADHEQDVVVAGLLVRLWVAAPAGHAFPTLASMCDRWADESERRWAAEDRPDLDAGLVRAGLDLLRTLPSEGAAGGAVLLATDLHAGNVLAAEREPWLAIDPKPHVGDRHYDVLQHLLNQGERLRADPAGLVRRLADRCGLDTDRLCTWLFARCVQEAPTWPGLAEVAARLAP